MLSYKIFKLKDLKSTNLIRVQSINKMTDGDHFAISCVFHLPASLYRELTLETSLRLPPPTDSAPRVGVSGGVSEEWRMLATPPLPPSLKANSMDMLNHHGDSVNNGVSFA